MADLRMVPIGYRRNGLPIWPIAGGSEDPPPDPTDPPADPQPADPSDDADKWKSLSRQNEKARKAAEKRAEEIEAELTKLREQSLSEQEKALEKARSEAADAAKSELAPTVRSLQVENAVIRHANGRFVDLDDVVSGIDHDALKFDDDGRVDEKSLTAELDALAERKPHWLAKPNHGSIDQGPRTEARVDVKPGLERLQHAYSANGK